MDREDITVAAIAGLLTGMVIWKRHNRQKSLANQVCKTMREIQNLTDTYSLIKQIEMDRKFKDIVEHYDQ